MMTMLSLVQWCWETSLPITTFDVSSPGILVDKQVSPLLSVISYTSATDVILEDRWPEANIVEEFIVLSGIKLLESTT